MSTSLTLNKWPRLLLGYLAVLCMAMSVPVVVRPQPAEAAALQLPCNFVPTPALKGMCDAVNGAVDSDDLSAALEIPGIPSAGEVAADAVGAVFGGWREDLGRWLASSVIESLRHMMDYINNETVPSLTDDWYLLQFSLFYGMVAFLGIGLSIGRFTEGTKNVDPLLQANAIGRLVVFFLVTGSLPFAVGWVVNLIDREITPGWLDLAGDSALTTLSDMIANMAADFDFFEMTFTTFGILIAGAGGGLLTYLLLELREAALHVFVFAEAFAMAMWVGGRWGGDMFRKITMALIGLISLKLAMAIVLTIGVGILGAEEGGNDTFLMGAIITLMVPVLGIVWYKLITHHQIQSSAYMSRMGRGLKWIKNH